METNQSNIGKTSLSLDIHTEELSVDVGSENTNKMDLDVTVMYSGLASSSNFLFSLLEALGVKIGDIQQEGEELKEYTERSFQDVQETMTMIQGAFSRFSEGITPKTVQTMSMMVGDERLQFIFTQSIQSDTKADLIYRFNGKTGNFSVDTAYIKHMTFGINAISNSHDVYKRWQVKSMSRTIDPETSYYLYAVVSKNDETGYFDLQETSQNDTDDDYYLMVGILNSERNGDRSFALVHGFTEVLPGQITTSVIRDSQGKLIIDLDKATITATEGARIIGDVEFGENSTGLSNISEWNELQQNVYEVKSSVQHVQDQIDGVVENWNGKGTPTTTNEPAVNWTTDNDKIAHINDTYINIEQYVDDETTPTSGQAWRWCKCEDYDIEQESISYQLPASTGSIKIGTIPIRDYGSAVLLVNGSTSTWLDDFAYDTEMRVVSGPPCTVRVEKTTGDVYVTDVSNFLVGSLSIIFYTGATIATDSEGNQIKLHWHPIADSDAVRALKEAAEATRAAESASKLNLIAGGSELVYNNQGSETTSYGKKYLPVKVNAGEVYTFKCEFAENLNPDDGINTFSVGMAGTNSGLGSIAPAAQLTFGKNLVATFKINEGVQDVYADLFFYKTNAPRAAQARFVNFSLIKGTIPLDVWEDYTGDAGKKNLVEEESSSISFTSAEDNGYVGHVITFRNIAFNKGEQYTVHYDSLTRTGGSYAQCSFYLYCNMNGVETNIGGAKWDASVGSSNGWHTFTCVNDSAGCDAGKVYLKIYPGVAGSVVKGNGFKITNLSFVKGSRPMMTWKRNEDYLFNAFQNGTTEISNGLVMAEAMMVKDESETVRGMFNGSDYAKDSTHGKLMFATGSNGATEANMKGATTKVYEDGHVIFKSGKLGTVNISEDGLWITRNGKTLKIDSEVGLSYGESTKKGWFDLNGCGDDGVFMRIDNSTNGVANYCPADREVALLVAADEQQPAVECPSGLFVGFRPYRRDISGKTAFLNQNDHTIWASSGTIHLPTKSSLARVFGQTYKIIHYDTYALTIISDEGLLRLFGGSSGMIDQSDNTYTSTQAEIIEIWNGGDNWYFVRHSM